VIPPTKTTIPTMSQTMIRMMGEHLVFLFFTLPFVVNHVFRLSFILVRLLVLLHPLLDWILGVILVCNHS